MTLHWFSSAFMLCLKIKMVWKIVGKCVRDFWGVNFSNTVAGEEFYSDANYHDVKNCVLFLNSACAFWMLVRHKRTSRFRF